MKKTGKGEFAKLGISPAISSAVTNYGYKEATAIQKKAIPLILEGYDVICNARTGSGKTACFLLPILHALENHSSTVGARALILCPTKELVLQTAGFAKEFARNTDLRICVIIGGVSMEAEFEKLHHNPDIIVATPGRWSHHLVEINLRMNACQYLVIDEADRLFELGFESQLHIILKSLPADVKKMLVSATLPTNVLEFSRLRMKRATVVNVDERLDVSEKLRLLLFAVRNEEKFAAVIALLRSYIPTDEQVLLFVATRHHAEYMTALCKEFEISVSAITGSDDVSTRMITFENFKSKRCRVLVVTDVAARGIDIPLLTHVVNADFPHSAKLFVHRVGRTARAGNSGTAYTFMTHQDLPYAMDLFQFLGKQLLPETVVNSPEYKKSENKEASAVVSVAGVCDHSYEQEKLDITLRENHEIKSLNKRVMNATKMYLKTRKGASPYAMKNARLWGEKHGTKGNFVSLVEKPHTFFSSGANADANNGSRRPLNEMLPSFLRISDEFQEKAKSLKALIGGFGNEVDIPALDFEGTHLEDLRSYRPKGKAKALAGVSSTHPATEEPKKQEPVVNTTKTKKGVSSGEFVMLTHPNQVDPGQESELKLRDLHISQLSFHVNNEEGTYSEKPSSKVQYVRRWNAKVRRFQMMPLDQAGQKMKVKNEAGVLVKEVKEKGYYKNWVATTKKRIQNAGEAEEEKIKQPARKQRKR